MSSNTIADRYEVVQTTEDGFVSRAIVKDLKAHGKLRTILSVNEQNLTNPNIVHWFNSQSELFSSISSDYVVDFIDRHAAGEIMESPTLVIEEPGTTLAELMSKGAIQPAAAQGIIARVLMGVNELHNLGYLHLDIRPETIGVNSTATEVKLLSLGNCTPMSTEAMTLAPNSKYAAAECYTPDAVMDKNTDVYSIGFLFYELLCGKEVFSDQFASILRTKTDLERATKWTNWHVSDKEAKPLGTAVSTVDEDVAALVHKMIDKNAANRYSNATTVINEINLLKGGAGAMGVTGEFNTKHRGKAAGKTGGFFSGPNRLWKIGGAALAGVMVLVLALAVILTRGPKVDMDEVNAAVAKIKSQRSAINTLGLSEDADAVKANEIYTKAVEADGQSISTVFSLIKESSAVYGTVLDEKAPVVMTDLVSQLELLQNQVDKYGVEGVSPVADASAEYDGLEDLEEKHTAYTASLVELTNSIRTNNRLVEIGSSSEQIDKTLAECKQYSQACEPSWYEDEQIRLVSLAPFKMDEMEVSMADFKIYAEQKSVVTEAERRNRSSVVDDPDRDFTRVITEDLNWKNAYKSTDTGLPVVHVTLADAKGYCKFKQQRLPSEAEWELAAGGYERTTYPWGNTWDDSKLYWAGTQTDGEILPAGSFLKSPHGFYDLAGGVSEWTSSLDDSGDYAFVKGASRFEANVANIRIAARRETPVIYSGEDVGFRCATDLEEWPVTEE